MPTPEELKKAVEEKLAKRQRARTDKMFLSNLLGYQFQEDVHPDLFANYIQFDDSKSLFEQSDQKRRLVLWSRGFFKTTSIIVEAVQLILNFPDISIMILEATLPKSKEVLMEIKSHFDGRNHNSKLDTLFPEFCASKMGSSTSFTVPARKRSRLAPTVFIASPKSNKAGWHPDAAFFDDLVNEQNYNNPELMKKVIQQFSHYEPLVNPGGYFYVTGTRYIFGDLYDHIIKENAREKALLGTDKWKITTRACWPLDEHGNRIGESYFPPRKVGDVIIGISTDELLAKQRSNPETFAAQYENRPIAAGKQIFTEMMVLGAVIDPKTVPSLSRPIMVLDLATSKSQRADDRVLCVGAADGYGRIYVTDLIGGQFSVPELGEHVIRMFLKHRPSKMLIEGNSAGHVFNEYVKLLASNRGLNIYLEFIKVNTALDAKNIRIEATQQRFKNKSLFFLLGIPSFAKLLEQYVQFPKSLHNDYPDAVALLVQEFSKTVLERPVKQPSMLDIILRAPDHPMVKAIETPLIQTTLGSDFS